MKILNFFQTVKIVTMSAASLWWALPSLAEDKHFSNVNGGSFSSASNWAPTGAPQPSDHAFIGSFTDVKNEWISLTQNTAVANLTVTNGNWLNNFLLGLPNYYTLNVAGTTTMSGKNVSGNGNFSHPSRIGIGRNLALGNDPDFTTGNLMVLNGGRFDMDRAIVNVNHLVSLEDGSLNGSGTLNLFGNGPVSMSMDGNVVVDYRGLTVNQLGTGKIDLNGQNQYSPSIYAIDYHAGQQAFASFTVNGTSLATPYQGEFYIREGSSVNMNLANGWAMGQGSQIHMFNNLDHDIYATVNGSSLNFGGEIILGPAHVKSRFNVPITFQGEAKVNMGWGGHLEFNGATNIEKGYFTVQESGVLDFNGPTVISGGQFMTQGAAGVNKGVVHFNNDTDWKGTVDLGQNTGGYVRQMGHAKVLSSTTINANQFDMDGQWGSSWNAYAGLTINANALGAYSDLTPNNMFGKITVHGTNLLNPAFLEVNLPNGDSWTHHNTLNLKGAPAGSPVVTLRGTGVQLLGNVVVEGRNATTAKVHLGGTTFLNDSGDIFHLAGGTHDHPNTISGSIIGNGTLSAANGRALVGSGQIFSNIDFQGNSELLARGGTLDIHGTLTKAGVIGTADSSGILHLHKNFNTSFVGHVNMNGGELRGPAITNGGLIKGHGLVKPDHLVNNGSIEARGGELVLSSPIMDLDGITDNGSLKALEGDLRITTPYGTFYGDAHVGGGRTLTIDHGWTQIGNLYLSSNGISAASIAGNDLLTLDNHTYVDGRGLLQLPTLFAGHALLLMDIGGLDQGTQYDWLQGESSITLGGALELALKNGFENHIALGDSFDVVTARGGLNGQFEQIFQPLNMPNGWFLKPEYYADRLQLTVASAVPEPSSAMLLSIATSCWALARRRRSFEWRRLN